ncbi:MAG: ATP-dependent helicase [Eubacteriales bacterium]|nr:ATP-dependent helicase [Eubacteriales bacterium]
MPKFNKGQEMAISHVNGPMIALAGPGSGKTTAMVHRIKNLIEKAGVDPSRILVITFTRASAKEMEERFLHLMKGKKYACTFGTFHSVFFYILKVAYGYTSSNILLEEEKYQLIRELIRKRKIECEDEEELIQEIISSMGMMKGDMIPLEHFYPQCLGDEVFRSLYREYEEIVTSRGKLDFDDMMVYCYELLKERPDILKGLQMRYTHILVDEFQDINKIQYEITKMFAKPQDNLFIVGDDDQSIYGFRGARPEIMLHFKEDYPEAVTALLDTNYRCTRNITEGALKLIGHNQIRYEKSLVSEKGYSEPIQIHHMKTLWEENQHVISQIQKYKKENIAFENMAVIVRTNIQARSIVNRLMEYNIPFQIRDKVPCVYDHFAVKNILDYVRLAMGIRDRDIFLKIINKPNRYISRDVFTEPVMSFQLLRENLEDKEWVIERVEQLEYELKILAGLKPFAAVHFIRKAIGYDEYLKDYATYRHLNVEDLYGPLDELQEMAKQYKTFSEWFDGMEVYREEFAKHMQEAKKERTGIMVTTMHSAKGLEFDVVFILEANEGMVPYKKAVKPEELEEERRMFYVAMTRARNHLHIYEVNEYYNKQLEPSRFLEEIVGVEDDVSGE